jgi:hypothetical protein
VDVNGGGDVMSTGRPRKVAVVGVAAGVELGGTEGVLINQLRLGGTSAAGEIRAADAGGEKSTTAGLAGSRVCSSESEFRYSRSS